MSIGLTYDLLNTCSPFHKQLRFCDVIPLDWYFLLLFCNRHFSIDSKGFSYRQRKSKEIDGLRLQLKMNQFLLFVRYKSLILCAHVGTHPTYSNQNLVVNRKTETTLSLYV